MVPRAAVYALVDQAAISAGNFLLIAVGAWMLPLSEQSKLVYVYTAYIATVLFNASAFFSAAPTMRVESSDPIGYARLLFRIQIASAVLFATCLTLLFIAAADRVGWAPNKLEMSWMWGFLVLQQLVDFHRRSTYVFGDVGHAALMSGALFMLRIGALWLLSPHRAVDFFAVLAVSTLPGVIAAFSGVRRGRGAPKESRSGVLSRHIELARWNAINAPLQWMGMHLPILLAGLLAGPAAAAIVASVRSVSTAANVFLELMETYVPALMAVRAQHQGTEGVRAVAARLYTGGGVLWSVAAIAILMFGEWLLSVLLGETYAQYWVVLLLLWVGNGFYFIGRVYGVRQRIMRRTSVELAGSLGGLAVLIGSWPLMSIFGVTGVALVMVAIQFGCTITQFAYARGMISNNNA